MLLSPFIWQTFRKSCIFDNGIKNEVEGYVWKPNDLSVFFGFCIYYFFFAYHFRKRTPTPHFLVISQSLPTRFSVHFESMSYFLVRF